MIRAVSAVLITFSLFLTFNVNAATQEQNSIVTESNSLIPIDTLTQAVKQSTQLNDNEKNDLILQLEQADKWQAQKAKTVAETEQIKSRIANIDERAANIKSEIAELQDNLKNVNTYTSENTDSETLSQELNQFQGALQKGNDQFLYWDSLLNSYQKLAIDGVQQQLEIEKTLSQLNPVSVDKKVTQQSVSDQVATVSLESRRQLLNAKLQQINLKLNRLDTLTRNAQMERDFWSQQKTIVSKIVSKLQDAVLTQKTQIAESALKQTSEDQITKDNPLYKLQQMLISVQQQKADLIKKEKQVQSNITESKDLLNQAEADFARDQQIVELQSSPETIARLFHKRLQSISELQVKDSKLFDLQNDINNAVLNQLLLSEKLRDHQTNVSVLDEALSQLDELDQAKYENAGLKLQMQYLHAAKDLQSLYPIFISRLSELNSLYLKQKDQYQQYSQFLNNHLLWLPNANKSTLMSFSALTENLTAVFSGNNMVTIYNDFKVALEKQVGQTILAVLVIGALLYWRKKIILKLHNYSAKTVSIRTDSFIYSIKAMFLTLALALPLPLILYTLYTILHANSGAADITSQLASSLLNAAILVIILNNLHHTCREKGLAEKHFHWNQTTVTAIFKETRWAIPFGAILIVLVGINADVLNNENQEVIGRYAFIILMLGLMTLIYRLWSPRRNIMKEAKAKEQKSTWVQLHVFWYSALMLIPALLIWTTISGYYYSSILIAEKLNLTIGLLLSAFILRELLLRSIYVNERQQRYKDRLHEREAYLAEQNKLPQEERSTNADELPVIDESDINYAKLNRQVKQTINLTFFFAMVAGLWVLWNDVLLAFDLVSNSTLPLTKSEVIDGVVQEVPLTLADLLQGLAFGVITLLLAKNLPGILEYTLLKFLPISPAVRYAISSLTQYLIAIIGFIVIFRALGIEWSNIQWLVAALSVGLGFGLQEIVANFVSGIILLFEQPIRVGDVVTVGETTGKVSKIRIRATTIVNWDRQELVIPNKDIITGDLINWSLSDPISRVRVDIGIAYGSDVNKAMKLMLEAAEQHPLILADPEPTVIFDSFGDNALLISLRGFVDNLENRIVIKSELNNIVNDKMNEAGIVIAFPQRDIHLDTLSPLEIRLKREEKVKTDKTEQTEIK